MDQFHNDDERNRRDLGLDFCNESIDLVKDNQDIDFNVNELNNLDSVTINRNLDSDNEVSKKYVDDSIGEGTIVRFDQALQKHIKVSVGNDTYNLTKYDKKQITDTTESKFVNIGSDL